MADLRLSAVMIAKDEKHNIAPCFESFWDHVDEVVLCDTGSRDGTIAEARRFAHERGAPDKLIVGRFKWCDDFAAARNHAHSLATGDVHLWLDLDERLIGAELLRRSARRLGRSPRLLCLVATYKDASGGEHWRPLLIRSGVRWHNRVNEAVDCGSRVKPVQGLHVQHARTAQRTRRDLLLSLAWARDVPSDWRAHFSVAMEALEREEWRVAARYARRALEIGVPQEMPQDKHASMLRCLARVERAQGDWRAAERHYRDGLTAWPKDAGIWLELGSLLLQRLNYTAAEDCAGKALEMAATPAARRSAAALIAAISGARQGYGHSALTLVA